MRAFISNHQGGFEEMRSKLERVKADLAAGQKAVADGIEMLRLVEGEKGAIRAKTDRLKEKGEALEAKYKEAKQENS